MTISGKTHLFDLFRITLKYQFKVFFENFITGVFSPKFDPKNCLPEILLAEKFSAEKKNRQKTFSAEFFYGRKNVQSKAFRPKN